MEKDRQRQKGGGNEERGEKSRRRRRKRREKNQGNQARLLLFLPLGKNEKVGKDLKLSVKNK